MVHYQSVNPESFLSKKRRLKEAKDVSVAKTTFTPWISETEWKKVYEQLFHGSPSYRSWRAAYTTMVRWSRMSDAGVPIAVVASIPLLRAKKHMEELSRPVPYHSSVRLASTVLHDSQGTGSALHQPGHIAVCERFCQGGGTSSQRAWQHYLHA